MQNIENARVSLDLIMNVLNNIEYNKIIIDYYSRYQNELEKHAPVAAINKTIKNKTENISNCNKFWEVDAYHKSLVKDYIKTNLCKDKFCSNCKKVKQASRMAKYMPELEKYNNNAYHLTLTSPNVNGIDLKNKIKLMARCYKTLNRYLTGNLKIKDIDFTSWGYKGSIRSLEVTFKNDDYHPHYHCFLILEGFQMSLKDKINDYSYSYGQFKQYFSDEEILIQKIWYLLINGETVTKKAIDELTLGYTCKLDKLQEGDYNELFKYMTKEVDERGDVLTYENFKVLYESLYRVKQIQGYGCLYQVTDDGDVEMLEMEYQKIIDELKKIENPELLRQKPQDLLLDKKYILISRKSYMKFMNNL